MEPAIQFSGVEHRFDKRAPWLFRDLAFELAPGHSMAITGPSGSGKSTLLSLALGLFTPTGGHISVLGTDWSSLSSRGRAAHRAAHVGVVFQFGELIDELTPLENVVLPALWSGTDHGEAQRRGVELLERLEVRTSARTTAVVSGGERVRIGVARALISRPEVILADEPTGALDEDGAAKMRDLLFELPESQSCSLLVDTHSAAVRERADSVVDLAAARTDHA